ncbi:hypothetical protein [Anaerosporobacter sp.]|uniref:hypothetical protein n=1 Tax=Anaerosporobacter sp. TaxID=1872529 RepID=UPI00286F8A4B|nr:hypothetical protein [Anaerosporobacter sp.]
MKNLKTKISIIAMMLIIISAFAGCGKKEKETEIEYQKGTLTETSFESEFLNLKFTVPEGYTMLTQDYMDELAQYSTEIMYEDASQTQLDYAKASTVYEMMCTETTKGSPNVNVAVENLYDNKVSVDEYMEITKTQLEASGIAYTFGDVRKDVELAGEKYSVLDCYGTYSGQELSQQIYLRKIGNRMMALTVTSTDDTAEMRDALLAAFSSYK